MPLPISIQNPIRGKRKARSQMCLVFCEDVKIIDREISTFIGYGNDDLVTPRKGFLIDAANQYQGPDNQWYQIYHERSYIPLKSISPPDPKVKIDYDLMLRQIWDEAQKVEKDRQHDRDKQDSLVDKIMWIITIPSVTFLLLGILEWMKKK